MYDIVKPFHANWNETVGMTWTLENGTKVFQKIKFSDLEHSHTKPPTPSVAYTIALVATVVLCNLAICYLTLGMK